MNDDIQRMIEFLETERQRAKVAYNESGFDVRSALGPIVRRYRYELAEQIRSLREQLD